MNYPASFPLQHLKSVLASAAMLLGVFTSQTHAQWAWAKSVGISGTTVWGATAMGVDGSFYFGGVSDKLAGNPTRGYVMAKYNDTAAAKWNTKLLGGIAAYAGETAVAVDTAGNSFMLDKFRDTPLVLPDTTQISYFLPCYFVAKFLPTGKMAWCKKLVVGGVSRFQVTADGTVGILATGVIKSFIFGNDTISGSASGSDAYFIEIKPDGTIGRSVAASAVSPFAFNFCQWKEPGKLFAVAAEAAALSTTLYHRGSVDLDAKTFTDDGTPLKVESAPNTFQWMNNGFPNSPTTVWDAKSGHLFQLMTAINDNPRLNSADTLIKQTNTQVRDGYAVELDDQMKVVHKIHLTNPVQIAMRDSQVVVTAIVRGTADFGFVSPDTTIKITLKSYLQDGFVAYVMDRDFKYKRHGLVEGTYQTTLDASVTMIGADGGVYLTLQVGGDVTYQGLPIVSRGRFLGTMISKLGLAGSASIPDAPKSLRSQIRPYLIGNALRIDRDGAFRFQLTDIRGLAVVSGAGFGDAVCDVSRLPQGMYSLTLAGNGATSHHLIRKIDP